MHDTDVVQPPGHRCNKLQSIHHSEQSAQQPRAQTCPTTSSNKNKKFPLTQTGGGVPFGCLCAGSGVRQEEPRLTGGDLSHHHVPPPPLFFRGARTEQTASSLLRVFLQGRGGFPSEASLNCGTTDTDTPAALSGSYSQSDRLSVARRRRTEPNFHYSSSQTSRRVLKSACFSQHCCREHPDLKRTKRTRSCFFMMKTHNGFY